MSSKVGKEIRQKLRQKLHMLLPWQLAIVAFYLVCMESPYIRHTFKLFVDLISAGRSDFKVFFLLIYLSVVLLVAYLPKPSVRWKHVRRLHLSAIAVVAIVYLFGVAEFAYTRIVYDLPVMDKTHVHWGNDHTTTNPIHIHESKVVLAVMAGWVGIPADKIYDVGSEFIGLLPAWLVMPHVFAYLVQVFICIVLIHRLRVLPRPYYVMAVLCNFIVLRGSVDGGIFFHEAVIAYPLFVWFNLLCIRPQFTEALFWRGMKWIALCIWVPYAAIDLTILLNLVDFRPSMRLLISLSAMGILFVFLWYAWRCGPLRGEKKTAYIIVGVLTILALPVTMIAFKKWDLGYMNFEYPYRPIERDFFVLMNDPLPQKTANILPIWHEKIGKRTLYYMHVEQPTILSKISTQLGLSEYHALISVPNSGCDPLARYTTSGYIKIIEAEREFESYHITYPPTENPLVTFDLAEVESGLYTMTMTRMHCVPGTQNLIAAILHEAGIHRSVFWIDGQQL